MTASMILMQMVAPHKEILRTCIVNLETFLLLVRMKLVKLLEQCIGITLVRACLILLWKMLLIKISYRK